MIRKILLQGLNGNAPAGVCLGKFAFELFGHPVHLGLGLFASDARLEARENQLSVKAKGLSIGIDAERSPDGKIFGSKPKAFGKNADDGVRLAVGSSLDGFADCARIAAKLLAPKIVSENRDMVATR